MDTSTRDKRHTVWPISFPWTMLKHPAVPSKNACRDMFLQMTFRPPGVTRPELKVTARIQTMSSNRRDVRRTACWQLCKNFLGSPLNLPWSAHHGLEFGEPTREDRSHIRVFRHHRFPQRWKSDDLTPHRLTVRVALEQPHDMLDRCLLLHRDDSFPDPRPPTAEEQKAADNRPGYNRLCRSVCPSHDSSVHALPSPRGEASRRAFKRKRLHSLITCPSLRLPSRW